MDLTDNFVIFVWRIQLEVGINCICYADDAKEGDRLAAVEDGGGTFHLYIWQIIIPGKSKEVYLK